MITLCLAIHDVKYVKFQMKMKDNLRILEQPVLFYRMTTDNCLIFIVEIDFISSNRSKQVKVIFRELTSIDEDDPSTLRDALGLNIAD